MAACTLKCLLRQMTLCVFACKVDKMLFFLFFYMQCVWADLMQKKNDTTLV